MSARHQVLWVGGDDIADLIVTGHAVTLYTDRPTLLSLDGQHFETIAAAKAAVLKMMANSPAGLLPAPFRHEAA